VVVDRVYAWTRNPMYLGLALTLAGVVVWRGSAVVAQAPWPLFCAFLQRFQIRPEERELAAADETSRRWVVRGPACPVSLAAIRAKADSGGGSIRLSGVTAGRVRAPFPEWPFSSPSPDVRQRAH